MARIELDGLPRWRKIFFRVFPLRLTNLLLTSRLYLVLKVLVKMAKFEENSKLLTLTLETFEVKVALGLKSTFTDG